MAQTDVIVLGAGIVGTCCAVHLAKRGLSVALVDRGAVGEGTSYGNTGIITGETLFPPGLSGGLALASAHRAQALAASQLSPRISAARRAVARGFRAASRPARLIETAK